MHSSVILGFRLRRTLSNLFLRKASRLDERQGVLHSAHRCRTSPGGNVPDIYVYISGDGE